MTWPKMGRSCWSRWHVPAYASEPSLHEPASTAETYSTKSLATAPAPACALVVQPLHEPPTLQLVHTSSASRRSESIGRGVPPMPSAHVGVAPLHDGARVGNRDRRGSSRSADGRESNETLNVTETNGDGNGDVIAELTRRMDAADDRSAGGRLALAVRPGDASLAAPFTARSGGVAPCVDLVRQGRAALVASQQMFKILGLNCLCTAYVMSVQFLDGVKFGDTQMTCGGLITARWRKRRPKMCRRR